MKDIKIENDIPIPSQEEQRGRKATYPFRQMGVGDSFELNGLDKKAKANLRNNSRLYGNRNNKKFTCRHTGDDSLRVWRIK